MSLSPRQDTVGLPVRRGGTGSPAEVHQCLQAGIGRTPSRSSSSTHAQIVAVGEKLAEGSVRHAH